ncbi:phosphocarrier protein [Altererythrobacter atlanticus]|uniref:Phosphocarrier protein NPr n=1 Tax=Croceibacterium atlanticum TaxID=1267766 RepID=A0A0F7KR35_9SPHN|nr:HPr family phosphocarrier protein [Croceibacterium atlanticum]AKH42049.1 Phosphocarrier protein NPr [Croceibacterium atlanticum]MBB5733383.1 phosphocarrier protein [Croceibacterium atlanticum]
MEEQRREVTIVNKRGLHARASAKFVATVTAMENCQVTVSKDGNSASGGSILGLMMLGAAKGDTVELAVSGHAADTRLEELASLIEDGFGED